MEITQAITTQNTKLDENLLAIIHCHIERMKIQGFLYASFCVDLRTRRIIANGCMSMDEAVEDHFRCKVVVGNSPEFDLFTCRIP